MIWKNKRTLKYFNDNQTLSSINYDGKKTVEKHAKQTITFK